MIPRNYNPRQFLEASLRERSARRNAFPDVASQPQLQVDESRLPAQSLVNSGLIKRLQI
jgi:hypothetical protein